MNDKINDSINKEINSTLKNMEEIKLKNDMVKSKIDERKVSLINELDEKTNNQIKRFEKEGKEKIDDISAITNAIDSNNFDEALKLLEKASI